MQKRVEFLASDAWVLLAILYAGSAGGASLRDIIAAADFINHAILTYEELDGGLARLSKAGYIRRDGDRFRPSRAVSRYHTKNISPQGRVRQELGRISAYLGAKPRSAGGGAGNADQGLSPAQLDRDEFEGAVDGYLNSTGP